MNVTGFIHRRTVSLSFALRTFLNLSSSLKLAATSKLRCVFVGKAEVPSFCRWKSEKTHRERSRETSKGVHLRRWNATVSLCVHLWSIWYVKENISEKKRKKKRNACLAKINIKVKRGFCIHIRCVEIYIYIYLYIFIYILYIIC